MSKYTYVNSADEPSAMSRHINNVKSRLSFEGPTEDDVKKHMSLLIGQAIFLMMLALVFIGFEAYTVNMEAQTKTPKSIIKTITQAIAQAPQQKDSRPTVLGTESLVQAQNVEPVEEKPVLSKDVYVIALTGDSIVETMGKGTPYLVQALEEKYPETRFITYNYAVGARNVSDNLKDFHEPFNYKDRHYESIDELEPDVIIVGSSAYNVFDPHDINHHWLEYTRLVQEALTITPHVYMLAEQAPLRKGFGFGVDGIVWEPSTAWVHTGRIIEQIKNVLGLSRTLGIPVIDLYTPSLSDDGQSGKRELISEQDNIHLSEEGHIFAAETIADTLDFEPVR